MVEPIEFEAYLKSQFSPESSFKIDYLEKDYHQGKVFVNTKGMTKEEKLKYHMLCEDQGPILAGAHREIRHLCIVWDLDRSDELNQSQRWLAKECLKLLKQLGLANQTHKQILLRVASYNTNSKTGQIDNLKYESCFMNTATGQFHGKAKITLQQSRRPQVVVTSVSPVKHGQEFGLKTQTLYYTPNKGQINKVREEVTYNGSALQSCMLTHFTTLRAMICFEDQCTDYKVDTNFHCTASLKRTQSTHSGKKLITTHFQTAVKNRREIQFKMESRLEN